MPNKLFCTIYADPYDREVLIYLCSWEKMRQSVLRKFPGCDLGGEDMAYEGCHLVVGFQGDSAPSTHIVWINPERIMDDEDMLLTLSHELIHVALTMFHYVEVPIDGLKNQEALAYLHTKMLGDGIGGITKLRKNQSSKKGGKSHG